MAKTLSSSGGKDSAWHQFVEGLALIDQTPQERSELRLRALEDRVRALEELSGRS